MGKVRLKELKAVAQRYTARKGRSEAEIAASRTPKPNRTGRCSRSHSSLGHPHLMKEETEAQGKAMTGPSSHSLTVVGLGLSLLWDTRIKLLSILDLRVARELQRVK